MERVFTRALLAVVALLATAATGRTADDTWLGRPEVPREKVTEALNAVWALPPEEAAARADALRPWTGKGSAEGQLASALLVAVALDRAGRTDEARAAYEALAAKNPGGSYGTTAEVRGRVVGVPEEQQVAAYRAVADDTEGAAREGWF